MQTGRHSILLVLAVVLMAGCGPRYYQTFDANYRDGHYTVRSGDTLYSIAWRYGLDYRAVAGWNALGPPYTIYPGQELRLTEPPLATARATAPAQRQSSTPSPQPAPTPPSPPSAQTKAPATAPAKAAPPVAATVPASSGALTWRWPTEGSVVRSFPADGSGKRGIGISGKAGQPVVAAYSGTVVYSGSGLIGYGNLLIIKHDSSFLSAYGYNRELLVGEGAEVKSGQIVARMGDNEDGQPMLHFEIRRDGKPVNPMSYLP